MRIKIKVEDKKLVPIKTHVTDAGWDLKSTENVTIPKGSTHLMHTGVHMAIPKSNMGLVCVRSSLGKKGITMTNSVGVIDSDYRGEIMVNLANYSTSDITINKYERFAQIVLMPINLEVLEITEFLPATDRGDGGFGSTNKNPVVPEKRKPVKEREKVIEPETVLIALHELKPADYVKISKKRLKEIYPEATGNIVTDLKIQKSEAISQTIDLGEISE